MNKVTKTIAAIVAGLSAQAAYAQCGACDGGDSNNPWYAFTDGTLMPEICAGTRLPGGDNVFAQQNTCQRIECEKVEGWPIANAEHIPMGTMRGIFPVQIDYAMWEGIHSFFYGLTGYGNSPFYVSWERIQKFYSDGKTLYNQFDYWIPMSDFFYGDPSLANAEKHAVCASMWNGASLDFRQGGVYQLHVFTQDTNDSSKRIVDYTTPTFMLPFNQEGYTTTNFNDAGIATQSVNPNLTQGGTTGSGGATGTTSGGFLESVMQSVFQPKQSSVNTIEGKLTQLENWGPLGVLSDLSNIENATAAGDPQVGIAVPQLQYSGGSNVGWSISSAPVVPMNFKPYGEYNANNPPPYRWFLGLVVYLSFIGAVARKLMPRQQV